MIRKSLNYSGYISPICNVCYCFIDIITHKLLNRMKKFVLVRLIPRMKRAEFFRFFDYKVENVAFRRIMVVFKYIYNGVVTFWKLVIALCAGCFKVFLAEHFSPTGVTCIQYKGMCSTIQFVSIFLFFIYFSRETIVESRLSDYLLFVRTVFPVFVHKVVDNNTLTQRPFVFINHWVEPLSIFNFEFFCKLV